MKIVYYFYPLVAGVFPLVFLYARNVNEVRPKKFFTIAGYFCMVFAFIYFFAFLYFGNVPKTSFCILLFVLFFYNSRLFFKKTKSLISSILFRSTEDHRRRIILRIVVMCLAFLLLLSIGVIINHTEYSFIIESRIIFALVLILTAVPVIRIVHFYIGMRSSKNKHSHLESTDSTETNDCPDIYYLIPDSYVRNDLLKSKFGFNNSAFIETLREKGFHIIQNALSNYPTTKLSIPSSLNMDYVQNIYNTKDDVSDQENLSKLYDFHLNNKVAKYLKTKGYKYIHLINHWEQMNFDEDPIADVSIKCGASNDFERVVFSGTFLTMFHSFLFEKQGRMNLRFLLDKLLCVHFEPSPKYVFSHLLCPHAPFYFDENGNEAPKDKIASQLYVGQMKYLNNVLISAIDNILLHKPDSVIIIQADHGVEAAMSGENISDNTANWPETPTGEMIAARYSILSAIRIPGGNKLFENVRTPVNTFRVVFNYIFKERFEILPEKQYYSTYEEMLKLSDITEMFGKLKRVN